eukprot:31550-Pelagococcus_subviridis.AAC.28
MNNESEKKRRTPRSRASRPPRVSARMTIVVIVKSQPASAGSVGELREKISARVSAHHPRAERRATRAGDAAGESIDRRRRVIRSGGAGGRRRGARGATHLDSSALPATRRARARSCEHRARPRARHLARAPRGSRARGYARMTRSRR